jgi:hypothetical protein
MIFYPQENRKKLRENKKECQFKQRPNKSNFTAINSTCLTKTNELSELNTNQ